MFVTVIPSFQIQKFHPPTVKMISEKKGDLSMVLIVPAWAEKKCSGLGATKDTLKVIKSHTFIMSHLMLLDYYSHLLVFQIQHL